MRAAGNKGVVTLWALVLVVTRESLLHLFSAARGSRGNKRSVSLGHLKVSTDLNQLNVIDLTITIR